MAHSCAGILLNNKKKQSIKTHNMDEFQMHRVQRKKTDCRDEVVARGKVTIVTVVAGL